MVIKWEDYAFTTAGAAAGAAGTAGASVGAAGAGPSAFSTTCVLGSASAFCLANLRLAALICSSFSSAVSLFLVECLTFLCS